MGIEAGPQRDQNRGRSLREGRESDPFGAAGETGRHWGLGPADARVSPPGPLDAGCSLLMAPSPGEGPPPGPGSAVGRGVISCCPGPSSPLLSHPTWQLWAPAVPRPPVLPALLGPSQLL